jgi:hypothetical protein
MTRSFLASAFVAAAGLAGPAIAGPLNKSYVPRDVQWVVHVDLEGAMASTIGQFVVTNHDELELGQLDQVKGQIGIDPFTDIKSVTVYGTGQDCEQGVAVIEATNAIEKLVEHARTHDKSFGQSKAGKDTIYSWSEHGTSRYGVIRAGKGEDDRLVVVASEKERLLNGLGVIDGKGETLADVTTGVLSRTPKRGSIVFAAGSDLGAAEAMPFKQADAIALDIGEANHEMFANMVIVPKKAEDATNLLHIMQGAVAMASMWAQSDPSLSELSALTRQISFSAEGGQVAVKFRYPSEKLLKAMQEAKSEHDRDHGSENDEHRHKRPAKNDPDDGDPDR